MTENPLITPEDIQPSTEGMEIIGTFNPGAIRFGDETLLLIRVAERPIQDDPNYIAVPMLDVSADTPHIKVLRFHRNDPDLDASDPRCISYRGKPYLTSISHLRVARSSDGIHFTVENQPALKPTEPWEAYGVEDPRITCIDGTYYITYTAVSEYGIATALASTHDFWQFEKHGLIFYPENRDVTIFPERIGGKYCCLHRPMPKYIGKLNMWVAYANDLLHWGEFKLLMSPRENSWDSERVGGGTVPIKTECGWLAIYHGANPMQGYCLGAVLLDIEHPERLLRRSVKPLLSPEAIYERIGFYERVVFSCGAVCDDMGNLWLYYGAADRVVSGARVKMSELLDALMDEPSEIAS
ncbi:MAG TPA: glycosidase [Armatimonadetes bacterium]|nr:glycosidase [Armatimonadota bacterium]